MLARLSQFGPLFADTNGQALGRGVTTRVICPAFGLLSG